jgi:hypothetical protein
MVVIMTDREKLERLAAETSRFAAELAGRFPDTTLVRFADAVAKLAAVLAQQPSPERDDVIDGNTPFAPS